MTTGYLGILLEGGGKQAVTRSLALRRTIRLTRDGKLPLTDFLRGLSFAFYAQSDQNSV